MLLIEPCCTQKQLLELRSKTANGAAAFFRGYGDLSLAEMLPVLLTRYSETDVMLVAPSIPNAAARVLVKAMERQWPDARGRKSLWGIARLTVITDLRKSKSPLASGWLKDNPFPDRLVLRDVQQNDTALLLPDFAMYGAFNLAYGGHFSGIATTRKQTVLSLRKMYEALPPRQQD